MINIILIIISFVLIIYLGIKNYDKVSHIDKFLLLILITIFTYFYVLSFPEQVNAEENIMKFNNITVSTGQFEGVAFVYDKKDQNEIDFILKVLQTTPTGLKIYNYYKNNKNIKIIIARQITEYDFSGITLNDRKITYIVIKKNVLVKETITLAHELIHSMFREVRKNNSSSQEEEMLCLYFTYQIRNELNGIPILDYCDIIYHINHSIYKDYRHLPEEEYQSFIKLLKDKGFDIIDIKSVKHLCGPKR